jgi:phage gp36-like protein
MYITSTELGIPEETLVRLTDDEGSGMVNTARIDEAVGAACGYVDAALSPRHDTPLAVPTELVKSVVRRLAVYNLYLRAGSVPDDVRRACEEASGMLAKAAEGTFCLGFAPGMEGPAFDLPEREFSRICMEGF